MPETGLGVLHTPNGAISNYSVPELVPEIEPEALKS